MPASRNASARQIEPPERRVLVEVAQDVGELQRAPQMMSQRNAVLFLHAEDADRQPPDRAGDPIAIAVERRVVGCADIVDYVHLHAVDDGVEILAPEPEIAHRRVQAERARNRLAGVERIDIGAPALESLPALGARDRSNPRCRPPDGKRSRFRTWPRAAPAAARASRYRTSCPTPARPQPCLKLLPAPTLTHPAVCGRSRTGGRRGGSSPIISRESRSPRPPPCRDGLARSADRVGSAMRPGASRRSE